MNHLGYACINQGFSTLPKSQRITTNRTMIKRTYHDRGIEYASELALQNLRDLHTILQWNLDHDIYFYRLSSNIVPWASEYDLVGPHRGQLCPQARYAAHIASWAV